MNIQEAKQEICSALRAYRLRDENGQRLFPPVRQRPILLMGPPGVGKTAILEQAARECGVGLVAYTMTHHTRQSAIGLPRIESRTYGGKTVQVTAYTLSEIIASVHDCMERTGLREGILFLDEINCVSETLAPTMLQLLQNKTFGGQPVPEGWLIVAAGNPPEYNKSVRDFDVVTLDRVRQIDVEPDCDAFLAYAAERNVHGAVRSYLALKPDRFYRVEQTAASRQFVTARGWEDLAALLKGYETLDIPVTEAVVAEYLRHDATARDFTAYYALYRRHGADYGITALLDGTLSEAARQEKVTLARSAGFEERFTVVSLLLDGLNTGFLRYREIDQTEVRLHEALQNLRSDWKKPQPFTGLGAVIERRRHGLEVKLEAGLTDAAAEQTERQVLQTLEAYDQTLRAEHIRDTETAFDRLRALFRAETERREALIAGLSGQLDRAFAFLADCFGEGQEMILFVTGLTRSQPAMEFITRHGCDAYLRRSEALRLRRREQELQEACKNLL